MKPIYSGCYQFYDAKGRRIAAFCRELDSKTAEIYLLFCSKKDQFSRKFARSIYENYIAGSQAITVKVSPITVEVPLIAEGKTLQTLINFLSEEYYLKSPEIPKFKSWLELFQFFSENFLPAIYPEEYTAV